MIDAGLLVMVAFISPFKADREMVRALVQNHEFVEIYMNTPIEDCERRDPKGLYKKARNGEIKNFTGIDSDYEVPTSAEITIDSVALNIEECADKVIHYLKNNKII